MSYEESIRHFQLLQNEKANSAAEKIGEFLRDIEQHIGLIDFIDNRDEQNLQNLQTYELLKLFRQLPQLFEISWTDATGHEKLFLSRVNLDRSMSNTDLSNTPGMKDALNGKVHYGLPYFLNDSEPHMLLMRPTADGGVVIADINLKLIWSTVSSISVHLVNTAYVVDGTGTLIAHPDIELVLRKLNFSPLPQVNSAIGSSKPVSGRSWSGNEVLYASASIPKAGWFVFVETPMAAIQGELNGLMRQALVILSIGLVLSILSSYLLARRMISPIRKLNEGMDRFTRGDFSKPISIQSKDELEHLADGFNRMGVALQTSYSELEAKVASRTQQLQQERARVTEMLHNMLPQAIALELAENGKVLPRRHESASVLFTDFSGFTEATSAMPAERMVRELSAIFEMFDSICDECGIERVKTIGDSYMAVGGVPILCEDHAERCVRAGLMMIEYLERRNSDAAFKWALRVGIHSGPVVSGIIGTRRYAFDVWGDTVNIASRLERTGEAGRVNISAYTCDLVKHAYQCSYRGKVSVKGKGEVDMYFVGGRI